MDRISTATKAVDLFGSGKHGFKDGNLGSGIAPTDFNAAWFNGVQEEVVAVIEGAGVVPASGTLTQLRQALKRFFGGNVTNIAFGASPFTLTADHAGVVTVDASGGNVVINLPAANVLAAPKYEFRRTDTTTANTVTVNRAGADTIDEGGTSFVLACKGVQKIAADGASKWVTVTPAAASQAEIDAATDDSKFVTPKKMRLGFSANFVANGYIVFPSWLGGMIIQWGSAASVGTGGSAIVFPTTFPTAVFAVVPVSNSGSSFTYTVTYGAITTAGFTAWASAVTAVQWIAFGK